MYGFLLNMWIMRKINETKLVEYLGKGYITQEEADMIMATPQMAV